MVVRQEALDARLDAQLARHVIDGAPIEAVCALEWRHGRFRKQKGARVFGIHGHLTMVLGNVGQLGNRGLDVIECVVSALVFETLAQTSPKRRIAHVEEQRLVERIPEDVSEKLVHGHASVPIVPMVVVMFVIMHSRSLLSNETSWSDQTVSFRRSKCLPRV